MPRLFTFQCMLHVIIYASSGPNVSDFFDDFPSYNKCKFLKILEEKMTITSQPTTLQLKHIRNSSVIPKSFSVVYTI